MENFANTNKEPTLQEIFNSMDYGKNTENTDKAAEWLKTVDITDKSGDLEAILDWAKANLRYESNKKANKTQLLNLAKHIEKNADMFAQIEILSRGVLSKDTRKVLPLLAEYFYYYANFTCDFEYNKGYVSGICDDENPLWVLGLVIAPALAANYPVVLQTGMKLAPAAHFLLALAQRAGIPQGALKLIPSSESGLQRHLDADSVAVVVLFGDLLDAKYRALNRRHTRFLALSPRTGAAMLVFDDCDATSAAEAVIEAAWGYQGMLPWSIDTVLIQENIFAMFADILRNKMASVRVGYGDDKLADVSYPSCTAVSARQAATVRKAKDQGIEVYAAHARPHVFAPTLLIGAKAAPNNVIGGGQRDGCVTLLPFRSVDEAVSLANNSRHGLGASVWTENVGLAHELAAKLTVNNVWINGHGLVAAEMPLAPLKDSGAGYFGGAEGLREYTDPWVKDSIKDVGLVETDERVATAITAAVGAGARWSKRPFLDRVKALQEVADRLESKTIDCSQKTETAFGEQFDGELRRCVTAKAERGASSRPGYVVTSFNTARGVVAVATERNSSLGASILAHALARGNAAVVLNRDPDYHALYAEISKGLPPGLLSVFPYTAEAERACAAHKALNGYFSFKWSPAFAYLPVDESKNFASLPPVCDYYHRLIAPKNVWCNVGRSLTCDL